MHDIMHVHPFHSVQPLLDKLPIVHLFISNLQISEFHLCNCKHARFMLSFYEGLSGLTLEAAIQHPHVGSAKTASENRGATEAAPQAATNHH